MKAVVVERWQEPEELVVREAPLPPLKKGMVMVDVKYAGANFYDILMVQGKYQYRPPFPFIPGTEFSGVVSRVGEGVTKWKVGDEVYGIAATGAYAEKIAVPAKSIRAIPRGMSLQYAAGFSMTYPTSYAALVYRANLRSGETLLVHAGAGGVGIAAIQIGKALGARVIATAGGPEKCAVAKAAGADHVIDYNNKEKDFVTEVKELTDSNGADVIFDPVGGEVFDNSTKCIAWGGRLLVIGFAGGTIPSIRTNRVLLKNCSIVGVFWGSYQYKQPSKVEEAFQQLEQMFVEGKLKPVVYPKSFRLEQLPLALREIAERKTFGKLIVEVDDNRQQQSAKL
ncbi:Zn-dependent oxidoreductase PA5234 [Balamuthia mandrillaris]